MNNNNQLILEYHLYDTVQLIKSNKYKKFINLSRKLVCHPYLVNDAFHIQLHIQLIRRLLYCQLKVIKKYFFNFSTKQQTILEVLLTCMSYCQNYLILLNKFQVAIQDQVQEKRISRKRRFFNEPNKLTIKQFAVIFDKLEPDQKSTKWLQNQFEELFIFIQKTLLYNYFYCKYSLLKEAALFLNKLIKLKPLQSFSSQFIHLLSLSLKNSAQFELNYSSYSECIDYGFYMLQNSLKEYHKPQSNLIPLQRQLIKLASVISLNLDLQSKSQELSDLHHNCIKSLNLSHFIVKQILKPLKVKLELTEYIETEYEFASEKFEQIMLEEQDLTLFTQFLFGHLNPEKQKTTKIIGNTKLQQMIQAKLQQNQNQQQPFQKGFRSINSDQFFYCSNKEEKLTLQEYLPIKIKSYHKRDTTSLSNPATSTNVTLTTTNINNFVKESPLTKRERSYYNPNLTSFVSQNTQSVSQNKINVQQQQNKQKKRQISLKCKRLNTNSDHKSSYLSQLINLRQKSSLTIKEELSGLEKYHLSLVEQLQKQQKPVKIGTIDEVFNKKIEAIAFEECLTLDQIKDTAKKIITTEWEIHKEMPVTKSLMKLVSVSDIQQLQIKSEYNKLQEQRAIQNQDYLNAQKDQARVEIDHKKEVKKLKMNQQKFQLQNRGSQPNILSSQKIQQLTPQENKVQEQLISQLQQQQNTIEVKVSPRVTRKNASLLYSSNLEDDGKEKGFALVKGQLIDLMLKNLEYRDELQKQEQLILPRQFRTKAISPSYGEGSMKSQNMSDFKSFAFSTNSTTMTTQHLHQK